MVMIIKKLKLKHVFSLLLAVCVISIALVVLKRNTQNITFSMITAAVNATKVSQIIFAVGATFISFVAMAANEIIAIKMLTGKKPDWKKTAIAGAVGNSLANTLGFPAFTLSAWRYRVYSAAGLKAGDIAKITAIAFIGIVFGFIGMASFALLFTSHIPYAGIILLVLLILFIFWLGKKNKNIGYKNWRITFPSAKLGALQLIIGFIDIAAAIYAAYILLPPDIGLLFPQFALFFIGSVLFGIASQAPGGIGVFEAGMLAALAADGRADVLAALLLYRVIYNLMPFCFASIVVAAHEVKSRY